MKLGKKFLSTIITISILISCIYISSSNVFAATGSAVYFDNTDFGWDEVYIYVYGVLENKAWPGEKMTKGQDGLYSKTFSAEYTSEYVIFNDGKSKQYPSPNGLQLNRGECKLLTNDRQWVYYGEPDDLSYGYAYFETNTSPDDDSIPIRLGLKGATIGEYSIDGSPRVPYRDGTVITIGKGKMANTYITLQLFVTTEEFETTETYTFRKNYTPNLDSNAPMEVNFGTDKSSGQKAGTKTVITAMVYNYVGTVTYEFSVDGKVLQKSEKNSVEWTPTKEGTYKLAVVATDSKGNSIKAEKDFVVGAPQIEKLPGDINTDGSVDIADARIIQQYVTKLISLSSIELRLGDYNGDGKTNIGDVTGIQRLVAGFN